MTQKLCRRLEGLEKISAAVAQRISSHASADSAIDEIRAILRLNNFPPEPNESLAETFSRFMGISVQELKAQMMEHAYSSQGGAHA